jgi:Tol biopolymer transport system component
VIRSDGTHRRQLAAGEGPVWSPDGRSLAYTPSRGAFTPGILDLRRGTTRRLPFPETVVEDWRSG